MRKILIVDDNKWIVDALSNAIETKLGGLAVLKAMNGQDALGIVTSADVDLILTDLEMPFMDGYRLIEAVRRTHPSIPVLVMTGNCSAKVRERLGPLGVRWCFAKPFDFNDVAHAVKTELQPAGPAPEDAAAKGTAPSPDAGNRTRRGRDPRRASSNG
jgi:CheY-like chemotaxis protein